MTHVTRDQIIHVTRARVTAISRFPVTCVTSGIARGLGELITGSTSVTDEALHRLTQTPRKSLRALCDRSASVNEATLTSLVTVTSEAAATVGADILQTRGGSDHTTPWIAGDCSVRPHDGKSRVVPIDSLRKPDERARASAPAREGWPSRYYKPLILFKKEGGMGKTPNPFRLITCHPAIAPGLQNSGGGPLQNIVQRCGALLTR